MSDILRVHISGKRSCTYPCMHYVTVHYKDGRKESLHLDSDDIIDMFSEFLTEEEKEHFSF